MFVYHDTAIKASRGLSLLVIPLIIFLMWAGWFFPLLLIVSILALTWYVSDIIHRKFMLEWVNKIRFRYFNG